MKSETSTETCQQSVAAPPARVDYEQASWGSCLGKVSGHGICVDHRRSPERFLSRN